MTSSPLRQAWLLLSAELLRERRRPELSSTVALLTLGVALVFVFAGLRGETTAAAPMVWTSLTLASVAVASRLHGRPGDRGRLRLFLSGPVGGAPVYLSKVGMVLLVLLGSGALSTVWAFLFFGFPLGAGVFAHLAGLFLGSLGLSLISSLVGALMDESSPDLLLAVLVMPLIFPVVIAGSKISESLCSHSADAVPDSLRLWLPFLIGFDVLFGVVCLWIYDPLTRR